MQEEVVSRHYSLHQSRPSKHPSQRQREEVASRYLSSHRQPPMKEDEESDTRKRPRVPGAVRRFPSSSPSLRGHTRAVDEEEPAKKRPRSMLPGARPTRRPPSRSRSRSPALRTPTRVSAPVKRPPPRTLHEGASEEARRKRRRPPSETAPAQVVLPTKKAWAEPSPESPELEPEEPIAKAPRRCWAVPPSRAPGSRDGGNEAESPGDEEEEEAEAEWGGLENVWTWLTAVRRTERRSDSPLPPVAIAKKKKGPDHEPPLTTENMKTLQRELDDTGLGCPSRWVAKVRSHAGDWARNLTAVKKAPRHDAGDARHIRPGDCLKVCCQSMCGDDHVCAIGPRKVRAASWVLCAGGGYLRTSDVAFTDTDISSCE